jgi:rRNA maturation RNase YbeY
LNLAFRNRQRTRALRLPLLRRLTRHVLEYELGVVDYELGFHFVEPEEMAEVNEQFLQHKGSTDVITFDHSGFGGAPISKSARRQAVHQHAGLETGAPMLHGEIFISVADAVKQSREFRTTWQSEVARYIIHALLHLRGHDDLQAAARRVMKREENRLLRRVAAEFSLPALAQTRNSKLKTRNFS